MVLRLRSPAPGNNWREAKCLGICATGDYDPFFEDMDEAVQYCNGEVDGTACPIREECLLFALTNNLREGVWGGCSELCRRAMRRRWPLLGGKRANPRWRWMTEGDALKGVTIFDLLVDDEDDEEDDD